MTAGYAIGGCISARSPLLPMQGARFLMLPSIISRVAPCGLNINARKQVLRSCPALQKPGICTVGFYADVDRAGTELDFCLRLRFTIKPNKPKPPIIMA